MTRPLTHKHHSKIVAGQRVSLAWSRTVLAFGVTTLTLMRWLPVMGAPVLIPMLLLITLGFGIALTQRRRYTHEIHGLEKGRLSPSTLSVAALTCGICLCGLLQVGLILLND